MTMTAIARSADGALRHEIDVNGRHTIVTDEPERLGGTDTAPTPHELLPAMVAACVSTMINLYARNRGWHLAEVAVEVAYDPDAMPRRVETTIHLPQELTPSQVARLERVAETCPVKRVLEAGFAFTKHVALDVPAAQR